MAHLFVTSEKVMHLNCREEGSFWAVSISVEMAEKGIPALCPDWPEYNKQISIGSIKVAPHSLENAQKVMDYLKEKQSQKVDLSPEQLQTITYCEEWIKSQTAAVDETAARKRKKSEVSE